MLTSSSGSLGEVAGDGALFADALDAASIARGIRCLDRDDDVARDLSRRGIVNAARFCPEACYSSIRQAYVAIV